MAVLERPASVLCALFLEETDGVCKPVVSFGTRGAEVIQPSQYVVVPAWWKGKARHGRLDDLAGSVGAKKSMVKKEIAARRFGFSGLAC